jgi:hypothetical protein
MNINVLPLAAFTLESSRGAERVVAEAHTLTLRLTRPALLSSHEPPMSGTARIEAVPGHSESMLRAAVLPAEGPGLTITF